MSRSLTVMVSGCPVCGKEHRVIFMPLLHPLHMPLEARGATHKAMCPTKRKTIYYRADEVSQ